MYCSISCRFIHIIYCILYTPAALHLLNEAQNTSNNKLSVVINTCLKTNEMQINE